MQVNEDLFVLLCRPRIFNSSLIFATRIGKNCCVLPGCSHCLQRIREYMQGLVLLLLFMFTLYPIKGLIQGELPSIERNSLTSVGFRSSPRDSQGETRISVSLAAGWGGQEHAHVEMEPPSLHRTQSFTARSRLLHQAARHPANNS